MQGHKLLLATVPKLSPKGLAADFCSCKPHASLSSDSNRGEILIYANSAPCVERIQRGAKGEDGDGAVEMGCDGED